MDFIKVIEEVTEHRAIMKMEEMQPGDVTCTYADITHLQHDFGFVPRVSIQQGIHSFYKWYQDYAHLF